MIQLSDFLRITADFIKALEASGEEDPLICTSTVAVNGLLMRFRDATMLKNKQDLMTFVII